MRTFELNGDRLWVPDFEYLNGELLYAAFTEGIKSPKVTDYLDSVLEFAVQDGGERTNFLAKLRSNLGEYQTTEADILQDFAPSGDRVSQKEGLRLVRQACDKLEEQVSSLSQQHPLEALSAQTN